MRANPFFELYVGDRILSEDFVRIFSPFLIEHAQALFLPGNVVVTGVQGSGKSMLLSLLKPQVRLDYAKAERAFPAHTSKHRFIGAGINLAHSNAIDFGYRRLAEDPAEVALLFGDFVNYTLAIDLLRSVQIFQDGGEDLCDEVGVRFGEQEKQALTHLVANDPSWNGYLEDCKSYDTLLERLKARTASYRSFLHMNTKELSDDLRYSKTSIGEPVAALAEHLKSSGSVERDVSVFIHIDQYEELANLDVGASQQPDYRSVINRALARRDPSVSYRIGSRGHAWRDHAKIFGTSARLEEERDYKLVNLDDKLRRNENRKTWIFPAFAADVFARRLHYAGMLDRLNHKPSQLLQQIFGTSLSAEEKARRYGGTSLSRAVHIDGNWPAEIKATLEDLTEKDPLSARLGEAWYLQKGDSDFTDLPWEDARRQWWKKERVDLALLQIAGRCAQRTASSGADEIIDLSGGNILVFISLCQFIWDSRLQVMESRAPTEQILKAGIAPDVQAVGIYKASDYWLKKVAQDTGRAANRLRFIKDLGTRFNRALLNDRRLTNIGHNGFSIADDDLENYPQVKDFLQELTDYGNLVQLSHTTKEKDRKARQKWYINPVLCPLLKVPYKRLKEPRYMAASDVYDWMVELKIFPGERKKPLISSSGSSDDLPLFRQAK